MVQNLECRPGCNINGGGLLVPVGLCEEGGGVEHGGERTQASLVHAAAGQLLEHQWTNQDTSLE
jgi:hypothetical protein